MCFPKISKYFHNMNSKNILSTKLSSISTWLNYVKHNKCRSRVPGLPFGPRGLIWCISTQMQSLLAHLAGWQKLHLASTAQTKLTNRPGTVWHDSFVHSFVRSFIRLIDWLAGWTDGISDRPVEPRPFDSCYTATLPRTCLEICKLCISLAMKQATFQTIQAGANPMGIAASSATKNCGTVLAVQMV